MAGKGTYAAYGQLKGLGTQFTDNLRHAERAGFQYREEERLAKEKKDTNRKEIAKQLGVDMKDLQFKNTGIQSVDKPVYEYFVRTKGEIAELATRMAADDSDIDAALKYQRIMNSAKTLSEFTKSYGSYQQDLKEGLSKGQYSEYLNGDLAEKINGSLAQGKYKILHDKNGELNLFMDGDDPNDPTAAISIPGFLNGNIGAPKARVNVSDVVEGLSKNYGTADITDESGVVTTRAKGFDPENVGRLKNEVDQIFGASKDKMTDAAKSAIADDLGANPNEMTEQQFKEFKEDIAGNVISRFDRVSSKDVDQSLILQREKFNYDKTRDAKADKEKEDEKNKATSADAIEVMTGETGGTLAEDGSTLFSLPEIATLDTGNGTVNTLQVQMDGNTLKFRGNIETGTGQDKTVTSTNITRDDQKNIIVRKIPNPETGKNFKNLSEFKQYLDNLKQGKVEPKEGYGNIDELPEL